MALFQRQEVITEKQWTDWNGIDQILNLLNSIKKNPNSRRLMVSAWNVNELDKMTLPPCHYGFQMYTTELTLEERQLEFCYRLGKDVSYAKKLEHVDLDKDCIAKIDLDTPFIFVPQ